MKRCPISGLMRDKEYDITRGTPGSKILYLSANPNGESEILKIILKPRPRLKKLAFDIDMSQLAIKGKSSMGNIVTRYPVLKVEHKEKGVSTLGGRKIWWDENTGRLNNDEKGIFLGEFADHEKIIVFTRSGMMRLSTTDFSNHFEDDLLLIQKFDPKKVYSAIYYDGEQKYYYAKRFIAEASEKPTSFIDEHPESYLAILSEQYYPRIEVRFGGKHKNRPPQVIEIADFIGVKSAKAKGKRITTHEVKEITELEPLRQAPPVNESDSLPDEESSGEDLNKPPASDESGNKRINDEPEQMLLF